MPPVTDQITDSVTQLRKNLQKSLADDIRKAIRDNNIQLISERLNLLFANINIYLAHQNSNLGSRAAIDILTSDEFAFTLLDLRVALDALDIKK